MSDVVRVAFEVRWSLKCNVRVELRVNQVYNYRNVVVVTIAHLNGIGLTLVKNHF